MDPTVYNETRKILFLGRSPKFWIITAVLVIIFFSLLSFFLGNALVRISVAYEQHVKQDGFSLTYDVIGVEQEQPAVSFAFGDYAFVPRSTETLHAKTDNAQTIVSVGKLPWWRVPHFDITLKAQREVRKIAGQTLGCTYATPRGTFSYDCASLARAVQINQPINGPWSATQDFQTDATSFARYKDGFLALTFPVLEEGGAARIDYLEGGAGNNPVRSFLLPDDFTKSDEDNLLIIADQSGQNPGAVIANTTTGEFIYVKNVERPDDFKRFKRKANDEERKAAFCALNKTDLVCLYGPIGDHENMGEVGETPEILPATAETFNLASPDNPVIAKTDASGVGSVYLTPRGAIFAFDPKNSLLYELTPADGHLDYRVIATDVADVTVSTSVHFIRKGQIYEYVPEQATSYLRYTSSHLRLSGLASYGDKTVFDAFIEYGDDDADNSETHAYLLTDKATITNAKRTEDYLPYSPLDEPGIAYMDYNEKYIYVALEPVFATDPATGIQSVDAAATEQKKSMILRKLTQDDVIDKRQVLFYAGE